MRTFETIVLGLGAMGSASLYQLAKRGNAVLGIDQFAPPHRFGSSHGDTRITRVAIGENEQYTLLARRSHEIWRAIEAETGESLLTANGCLVLSSDAPRAPTHVENFFENTVAAAERYGIPHERLNAQGVRARFPAYKARDNEKAFFELGGGFLRVENCVAANLVLARKHGAEIHTGEKVLGFEPTPHGVTVTTERGSYAADRLVITAGAWLPALIGEKHRGQFKVLRRVQYWFDIDGPIEPLSAGEFPGVPVGAAGQAAEHLRLPGDQWPRRQFQARNRAIRHRDNSGRCETGSHAAGDRGDVPRLRRTLLQGCNETLPEILCLPLHQR